MVYMFKALNITLIIYQKYGFINTHVTSDTSHIKDYKIINYPQVHDI